MVMRYEGWGRSDNVDCFSIASMSGCILLVGTQIVMARHPFLTVPTS